MTSAKCFLGCTNVRYGTRIIAILDFWICVILMIKCISILNPFHNSYPLKNNIDIHLQDRSYSTAYDVEIFDDNNEGNNIEDDFIVFGHIFLLCVFLYINYYLKDSTYDYKVHKISQWLAINTIFLLVYVIATTYVAVKHYRHDFFYYSIPFCVIHACQIYVVKSFYDERLDATWPYVAQLAARYAADGPVAVQRRNVADPRVPDGRPTTTTTTTAHPVNRGQSVTHPDDDVAATAARQQRYGLPATAPVYPLVSDAASVYPPLPATASVYPPLPAAADPMGLPREAGCKPPAYSS